MRTNASADGCGLRMGTDQTGQTVGSILYPTQRDHGFMTEEGWVGV